MPLRFAITSRPSRCEEDLHLLADKHARHTKKKGTDLRSVPSNCSAASKQTTYCSGLLAEVAAVDDS